jgi:AcrR family transcriptional regulator
MAEENRRVRRTRRALTDALVSLVLEKGYEKLTVQDILDRSDVGRSTFYAHYRDKESLLLACFDDMERQLRSEIAQRAPSDASFPPALPVAKVFAHAYRHQRIYRALNGKQGGNTVQRYLHGLVGALLAENLRPQLHSNSSDDMPAEVVAEFYTAAALGLLTWWIDHNFCRGPAWLTAVYEELAAHGLPTQAGSQGVQVCGPLHKPTRT